MKSDREFIDGIYEKAKNYTTEENSTSLTTYRRKISRPYVWQTLSCAAALLLLCVAIDGINGKEKLQVHSGAEPTVVAQETGIAFARYMPEPSRQSITATGEVSFVAPEEGYFLLTVEEMSSMAEEEKPEVIQVLYDPAIYDAEEFALGTKLSVELWNGDVYGWLTELFKEADYPVYTLQ